MRSPRHIRPTVVHHLISRFVDRDWAFTHDLEREAYLRRLGVAIEGSDWRCLAYALMSNHIHLAVIAGTSDLGCWLKRAHSPFANWLNKRHGRLGPLFADRPAVWAVRPANEARLIAYIHTNPVRAQVTPDAASSTWTSHRAYSGAALAPAWLDVAEGHRRCGTTAEGFDRWIAASAADLRYPPLAKARRAGYRFGALEVGTSLAEPPEFALVARRDARIRPPAAAVVPVAGDVLQLSPQRFSSRSRSDLAAVVRARQTALHTGVALGLPIAEVSAALGITRQAGSRLVHRGVDDGVRAAIHVACERLTSVTPSPVSA